MLRGEIVERDGRLFVQEPWERDLFRPVRSRCGWPTGLRAKDWARIIGQQAEWDRNGCFRLPNGMNIGLVKGGETRAAYYEEEPIPRPRGRTWVNARYDYGKWRR